MTRLPPGAGAALLAALLFGLSTPFAKLLLADVPPVLLAGLLYLGSGVGLTLGRWLRRFGGGESAPLARRDLPWLAGAIAFGGVLGPVLLMTSSRRPAREATFPSRLSWAPPCPLPCSERPSRRNYWRRPC